MRVNIIHQGREACMPRLPVKGTGTLVFMLLTGCAVLGGCATTPPKDVNNVCDIFKDKNGWHKAAQKSEKRWASPIPVMMAVMHQESKYQSDIKPPRRRILWVIPGSRPSSAFGYAQALDQTWETYQHSTGRGGADRDSFSDAIDFIGWYNHQSKTKNKIKSDDAYHMYLAYHEGQGGFKRRSFKKKVWLKNVAKKVSRQAARYRTQYAGCKDSLDSSWWPF